MFGPNEIIDFQGDPRPDSVTPGSAFHRKIVPQDRTVMALVGWLVCTRLHPTFWPDQISVYWADGLIILIASLWFLVIGRTAYVGTTRVFLGSTLVACVLGISISAGILVSFNDPIESLVNLGRFLYYGVLLLFLVSVIGNIVVTSDRPVHSWLLRWVDWAFLVNFAIVIIQLFDPPVLGEAIRMLFGSTKLRSIWSGYPRVYGAFYNANWFAVFLGFCTIGWVSAWATGIRSFPWLMKRIMPMMLTLVVAGSRTGIIGVLVGVGWILMASRRLKVLVVSVLLVILFAWGLYVLSESVPLIERTVNRFSSLSVDTDSLVTDRSFVARVETWQIGLKGFTEKPWLGHGGHTLEINLLPHNSFVTLLLTFGVIGTGVLGAWIGYLSLRVMMGDGQSCTQKWVKHWFLGFTVAFGVMAMAAEFVYTTQVTLLWVGLLALALVVTQRKMIPLPS